MEGAFSHLLGKCYLGFICPRRMPAKVLEPSRAPAHKKVSLSFLLMNMLNDIEDKFFLLYLILYFLPFIDCSAPFTSPPSGAR